MSNSVTTKDVVNEVAHRQATSNTDVTHRVLVQRFAGSTAPGTDSSVENLIESMIPTLLLCRPGDTAYDLTAEGWLESDLSGVVEQIVDAYLRSYRLAVPDIVGRLTITGKDLAANGIGDADKALVWAVGRAFYLYQSGSIQSERDRLSCSPPSTSTSC
jgi:hypothetical protein